MERFDYRPSIRVVFGADALDMLDDAHYDGLGGLALQLEGRRVLLVTDPGVVSAGIVARARESLAGSGLTPVVFDGVEENPTTRHVEDAVALARADGPIDLIVGLGGGSAMDCAKGANFLLTNGGAMEDYWGMDLASRPMLPSIGIPTTAGTGSEAQSFALIAQEGTHRKMACGDRKARFRVVILDPTLTVSAPMRVAAAAGMDAIAHAVESHVSTRRNAVSSMFSARAWTLLTGSFVAALTDPQDVEARGRMLWGAHLAGAAIENAMLGAAHACANPLTAQHGIAHGVAVGLMLPHVIRFNGNTNDRLYGDLCGPVDGTPGTTEGCAESVVERIADLRATANLPRCLADCGVHADSLPGLAKEAAAEWTGRFNPRPVTETDFLELYEAAL